ncbi:integrase core domain protein [Mycobacterium xenopi 4042]|uniref:Integrase core domain protein n=1 Tax=Mycobacterium xenopi 4042 TaxID=1299334 RepID=X8E5A8_MYCXE|nr:integrase core domain protein [Mycobacterium xenopi 4042]
MPLDGGGFGYTAFVIDAYAGLIAGWECSLTKNTAFVERAIRQATAYRARQGHPLTGDTIHHSDAGSQYTATHFTETLMLAGLVPSIGTVGDALDNALAETTIGLYKTECVRAGSRSAPDRSAPSPTWRTSPRRGCTGITPPGSCTALAAARQPKPRPSTTPGCKPATPSAVRRLGSRRGVTQHRWQTRDLWRSC